ncbi:hypothetical protein AVEN_271051-1 [Araneus ventricosus]|uniref:Uncharacterized protein n=1 Tax=Araneus ventricosus TaxID=182803 RepID=A0A4Y2FD85_ARAVE|nr:hypothetical protein AVEN_271051-1 [Araneus ventricosus]
MLTPYEKEMECLLKLLADVETDEVSDFGNEDNGPEGVSEENFADHESFSNNDTESEEDANSGNEGVDNTAGFHQKMSHSGGKQNLGRIFSLVVIILYRAHLEKKDKR